MDNYNEYFQETTPLVQNATPPKRRLSLRSIHVSKRTFFSIASLLVLTGGLLAGVVLTKRSQEVRKKASGNTVKLSFISSPATASVGQTVSVTLLADLNASPYNLTGITARVLYPESQLSLQSINLVDITNPAFLFAHSFPNQQATFLNAQDTSIPGVINITLGRPCTTSSPYSCYSPGKNDVPGGAAIVANFSFIVKDNAPDGPAIIRLDPNADYTLISAIDTSVSPPSLVCDGSDCTVSMVDPDSLNESVSVQIGNGAPVPVPCTGNDGSSCGLNCPVCSPDDETCMERPCLEDGVCTNHICVPPQPAVTVLNNFATGQSCDQVCAASGMTCTKIGISNDGTSQVYREYYAAGGYCRNHNIYPANGCDIPMTDSGHADEASPDGRKCLWAYCQCSQTSLASPTPTTPPETMCGNSILEDQEECDDGNTTSGDGCSSICVSEQPPVCPAISLENCDVDKNGVFDPNDYDVAKSCSNSGGTASGDCTTADVNCDGTVTISDIQALTSFCPATIIPSPTETTIPTPPPTLPPEPPLSPTSPPEAGKTNLTLKLKFQGIVSHRASKTVKVSLVATPDGTGTTHVYDNVPIHSDDGGIYTGFIANVDPGIYDIYVKGWAHLQKKFDRQIISLTPDITLDLSGVNLLAGDAAGAADSQGNTTGDNVLNVVDIGKLIEDYYPNTPAGSIGDFNLDGRINIVDIGIIVENYLVGHGDSYTNAQ